MNDIETYLIAIAAILLVWCVYQYLDKKYGVEFSKTAKTLKLKYMRHYNVDIEKTFKDFSFFSIGSHKSINNLLYGEYKGYQVRIFEYGYKKEHRSSALRQNLIFIQLPDYQLPEFQLCPQKEIHQTGSTYGYQVVNFEHVPAFWSRYLIRAMNQKSVRLLFSKKVIYHLIKLKNLCIESTGKRLVFFRYNKNVAPHQIKPFLEETIQTIKILCQSSTNIQ